MREGFDTETRKSFIFLQGLYWSTLRPMPSRKRKPAQVSSKGQHEIVLSPLFEMKDPRYKAKYAEMTEEEMKAAARQYAELILDAVEKEFGYLPTPPSEEEFHRLWNEVMKKNG